MQSRHFLRSSILATILIISFIAYLEYYWRSKGYIISYNDDKVTWAAERKKVYDSTRRTTVFIGSSRIKFDLDIDTWESLTGERAVQLAVVGSSCRRILFDLANDEKFTGKLIVEVLEPVFFSTGNREREKVVMDAIDYFHEETPAQKSGAVINKFLESKFVFLDEVKFGLNSLLVDVKLKNREGIIRRTLPRRESAIVTERRQNKFTPFFLDNPEKIKNWIAIRVREGAIRRIPPLTGTTLDSFLLSIKTATDKIKSRGGDVIFVRPPSNGVALERETIKEPREKYWDRLLSYTDCVGYHFADYAESAGLKCPDESHLAPPDAIRYTKHLVFMLKQKGWVH